MCLSGCLMLYKDGTPLEDITCPCGEGYWNIFKERFIHGDSVRAGRAPSRQEYETKALEQLSRKQYDAKMREDEAMVKAKKQEEAKLRQDERIRQREVKIRGELPGIEYEAKMREQWISHFLDCEIKRGLDDRATQEGRNNGSTKRRALLELDQIRRGDYESKGRSQSLDETQRRPSQELYDVYPPPSLRSGREQVYSSSTLMSQPQAAMPLMVRSEGRHPSHTEDRHAPLERTASHPTSYDRQSSHREGTPDLDRPKPLLAPRSTATMANDFFLPGDGINREVIQNEITKYLGKDATVRVYQMQDGRRGYLITAYRVLTSAMISSIKDTSFNFENEQQRGQNRGRQAVRHDDLAADNRQLVQDRSSTSDHSRSTIDIDDGPHPKSDNWPSSRPEDTTILDRHRPFEEAASNRQLGASTRDERSQAWMSGSREYFLPREGISLAVLEHHRDKKTFGAWDTIKPISHAGKQGYTIRAVRALSSNDIAQLKQDSKKYEKHMLTRLRTEQPTVIDNRDRHGAPQPALARPRRDSQQYNYNADDLTTDMRSTRVAPYPAEATSALYEEDSRRPYASSTGLEDEQSSRHEHQDTERQFDNYSDTQER